jgi:hypothetical protein
MRPLVTVAAALLAITLSVAAALGEVAVYKNPFSSRAAIGDLQKVNGGNVCKRGWDKGAKELSLSIKKGSEPCVFATPVHGDASQPNHQLDIKATISKQVPKSLRDKLFVAISVRNNQSTGYELRVFPGAGSWELRRDPEIEGFPMQGTVAAGVGLGKANKLSLQAFDDRITASVNGEKLVDAFVDPSPGEVEGRRTTIAFGSEAEVKEGVAATFDDLAVLIPDP